MAEEDKKEKDLEEEKDHAEEKAKEESAPKETETPEVVSKAEEETSHDPNYFQNLMARYDAATKNRTMPEQNATLAPSPQMTGLNPPMQAINNLPPETLAPEEQRGLNTNIIPGINQNYELANPPGATPVQPIPAAKPEAGEEDTDALDATTATKNKVAPIVQAQQQSPQVNPTINTVENLKRTQDAANKIRNNAEFLKSISYLSAGIAHAPKVNTEIWDDQAKGADELEKNFKALGDQEANDPNSQQSQTFRDYARRFGVKIPDTMSASNGQQLLPYIFKGYEAQEQRDARHEDLKLKYAQLAELSKEKGAEKKDKDYDTRLAKASQELDALQGGRGLLKAPTQKLQQSQSLEGLLNQYPDLNKMPPAQIAEFTSGFNNLVTGGQATDVKLRKILPNNIAMHGADILQWISVNPQGAQQKEFLDQMSNSIKAQKKVAEDQINEGLNKHLKSIERTLRPEDVKSLRTTRGITEPSEKKAESASQEGGMVSIRRKSDGAVSQVPASNAKKFLDQPDRFEKV